MAAHFSVHIGPQRRNTLEKAGLDPDTEPWKLIEALLERNVQLDKLYWVMKRAQDAIIESHTLMQPDFELLDKLEARIEKNGKLDDQSGSSSETDQTDEIDPAEETDE